MLLRSLYRHPPEILLVRAGGYNLLFRCVPSTSKPVDVVWTPEVFSMNRERFERHRLRAELLRSRGERPGRAGRRVRASSFSVRWLALQSDLYASIKSLRPVETTDTKVSDGSDDDDPGNPTVNFRGQKHGNATHRSLTDPEARLAQGDGQPALLAHGGACADGQPSSARV